MIALLTSEPYLFQPKNGNIENNIAIVHIVSIIAFAYKEIDEYFLFNFLISWSKMNITIIIKWN